VVVQLNPIVMQRILGLQKQRKDFCGEGGGSGGIAFLERVGGCGGCPVIWGGEGYCGG